MNRNTAVKLAVAALVAGAVAGGIGVGHAQVVSGDNSTAVTTTTVDPGTSATANVVTPEQTG